MYEEYYLEESPLDEWVHEDDLPDLEFMKDMTISVINAIYETGDIENLEDCLEELAAGFDLQIPNKKPMLTKGGTYGA